MTSVSVNPDPRGHYVRRDFVRGKKVSVISTDSDFESIVNNTDMTTLTANPAKYMGKSQLT